MKYQCLFYSLNLSQDLLHYRVKRFWSPLFSLLGFAIYIELPSNSILRVDHKTSLSISKCTLYFYSQSINSHEFKVKKLRPVFGLPRKVLNHIQHQTRINEQKNLARENLIMMHVRPERIEEFYRNIIYETRSSHKTRRRLVSSGRCLDQAPGIQSGA